MKTNKKHGGSSMTIRILILIITLVISVINCSETDLTKKQNLSVNKIVVNKGCEDKEVQENTIHHPIDSASVNCNHCNSFNIEVSIVGSYQLSVPIGKQNKTNFKTDCLNNKDQNMAQQNSEDTNYSEVIVIEEQTTGKESPMEKRINQIIEEESGIAGIDPNLVKAIIQVESNYNPKATSRVGARGLMQLMPATAKILKVKNISDPRENIKAGSKFLKFLLKEFKTKDHAIAAYNAGPGIVKKYKGIPPYKETIHYVKKVNYYYNKYSREL